MLIICLNKLCYLTVFLLKLSQHISTETNFFFISSHASTKHYYFVLVKFNETIVKKINKKRQYTILLLIFNYCICL